MLHVLRHYLPLRKGILILSETVIITVVVMTGMSAHLWTVATRTRHLLANENLLVSNARWICLLSSFLIAVLAQITISFNELYDFRISSSRYDRAARFLGSAGSGVLLVAAAVGLLEVAGVPRLIEFPGLPFAQTVVLLTISLIAAFVLLYFWRNLFHGVIRRMSFNARLMIVGTGRLAQRTADELLSRGDSGYDIVAMVSPAVGPHARRKHQPRSDENPYPSTGNPWFEAGAAAPVLTMESDGGVRTAAARKLLVDADPKPSTLATALRTKPVETTESLYELTHRLRVDDIVVAFEDRRGSFPTEELLRCRLDGIVVQEAETFYEQLTGKIPAEAMRPSYLILNRGFVQHPLAVIVKRIFDVVLSLLGIVFLSPVMFVAAVLIRLDTPGPILFRQERSGQNGKSFSVHKFRSMRTDAEKDTGPVWAQENDPRVTRIGRFLRRTRIDELPQLFNVLAGSMSMVGPRPERPEFIEELTAKVPYYSQRLIAKPGLTGWAQINYPYGNTVEDALQKLQYDLFYIKYQSIVFDLSILFNTVKTVVLGKGT